MRSIIRHERDASPRRGPRTSLGKRPAFDRDFARDRAPHAKERLEQFRAAAADKPRDADHFARADLEIDRRVRMGFGAHAAKREPSGAERDVAARHRRHAAADHERDDRFARRVVPIEFAPDRPVAKHHDAIGDPKHLVEAVADEDDRGATALEFGKKREQPVGLRLRKARGRLVEDEDPRVRRERLGDLDELPRADPERRDGRVGRDAQADLRKRLLGESRRLPAIEHAEPSRLATEHDVRGDVEVLGEVELLVDKRDAAALRVADRTQPHRFAVDEERPFVGPLHAREDLHEGALAGAVLADHCEHLARADRRVDAVEGEHAAEALREAAALDHRARRDMLGGARHCSVSRRSLPTPREPSSRLRTRRDCPA